MWAARAAGTVMKAQRARHEAKGDPGALSYVLVRKIKSRPSRRRAGSYWEIGSFVFYLSIVALGERILGLEGYLRRRKASALHRSPNALGVRLRAAGCLIP